ncbi:MAG: Gfo/Idh/MocA family protein [Candidatus Zixiibacteriota bacterium]
MNTIKTAVIGVGHLGRHHLNWLSKLEQSELIGLYDIDGEKAKKHANDHQITAFGSLIELIDGVEAVSIVVPTTAHCAVASQCIEAGRHCLVEKPVTATLDEANALVRLAAAHDVKVTVGQIERFNPAVRALSEYDIRPSFIEAHRLAAFDPRGTDVAVVLDLMIHDIDLALSFVDSPVEDIQASAVAIVSEQADIANARLTFKNGAVANLTASRISLTAMRKLRFFQQSGYFSLDLASKQADTYQLAEGNSEGEGLRLPLGKSGKDIIYNKRVDDGKDMLGLELGSFLDAIIHNRPVAVTLEEAAESLRVALDVERIGLESLKRVTESAQA